MTPHDEALARLTADIPTELSLAQLAQLVASRDVWLGACRLEELDASQATLLKRRQTELSDAIERVRESLCKQRDGAMRARAATNMGHRAPTRTSRRA